MLLDEDCLYSVHSISVLVIFKKKKKIKKKEYGLISLIYGFPEDDVLTSSSTTTLLFSSFSLIMIATSFFSPSFPIIITVLT